MNKKGYFTCIASACLFGFAPLITRAIYSFQVDAVGLGFYRGLFALPFLYYLAKRDHGTIGVPLREFKKIVPAAVFGSALTTLFLNLAYGYIDIGTASTLHFMHPVFVTLICVLLFHEKMQLTKVISLLLAVCGIFAFLDFGNLTDLKGICFALASACTYAFYFSAIDKLKLKRLNTAVLSFWTSVIVTVSFLIMGIFSGSLFVPQSFILIALLLANAVVCQVAAVTLLQVGIKLLGSQSASLMSLFEPVTGIALGCLFLNETLTFEKGIGCIFIFAAVILHTYSDTNVEKSGMKAEKWVRD